MYIHLIACVYIDVQRFHILHTRCKQQHFTQEFIIHVNICIIQLLFNYSYIGQWIHVKGIVHGSHQLTDVTAQVSRWKYSL